MRLRVAPEAEQELAEAAEWYEARRPGLGIDFVAIMDRELEEIVAAPLAHALWRSDRVYRRRVVRRFPYVIFFRAAQDEVVVVAFAHTTTPRSGRPRRRFISGLRGGDEAAGERASAGIRRRPRGVMGSRRIRAWAPTRRSLAASGGTIGRALTAGR